MEASNKGDSGEQRIFYQPIELKVPFLAIKFILDKFTSRGHHRQQISTFPNLWRGLPIIVGVVTLHTLPHQRTIMPTHAKDQINLLISTALKTAGAGYYGRYVSFIILHYLTPQKGGSGEPVCLCVYLYNNPFKTPTPAPDLKRN